MHACIVVSAYPSFFIYKSISKICSFLDGPGLSCGAGAGFRRKFASKDAGAHALGGHVLEFLARIPGVGNTA